MYGQSKLKALVTNIVMQRIKMVEAADVNNMLCTCKMQWYILGMLTIITLGMFYLVTNKIRKSSFFNICFLTIPRYCSSYLTPTHTYL